MKNIFYLLIVGSRSYCNYNELCKVCDFLLKYQIIAHRRIVIISGGAKKGADNLAERYADERGYEKHIMSADWNKYGKSAGYRRNKNMHSFIAESSYNKRGVICFWDMKSKGTQHSFKLAKEYSNPLRVFNTISHCFLSDSEVEKYI